MTDRTPKHYSRVRFDSLHALVKAVKEGSYLPAVVGIVDSNPEWSPEDPVEIVVQQSRDW